MWQLVTYYEFINIFLHDWHWIITVYLNTPPWTVPLITDVHTESEKESERRVVSCWDVIDPWGHKKNIAQMYIWVFLNKTIVIFCDEELQSSLNFAFH